MNRNNGSFDLIADIPFPTFLRDPSIALASVPESRSIHLLCRKGNDSYLAAKALRRCLASSTATTTHRVFDIVGGLQAWSAEVDHEFPVY
jgi:adenylyltransferase/sulfurtransferase